MKYGIVVPGPLLPVRGKALRIREIRELAAIEGSSPPETRLRRFARRPCSRVGAVAPGSVGGRSSDLGGVGDDRPDRCFDPRQAALDRYARVDPMERFRVSASGLSRQASSTRTFRASAL